MQLVPITTNVVSSNPVHGEVYLIQHYVIKFVSDLRQVDGFQRVTGTPVSSTNKTDQYNWNIVESGIKHHKLNISKIYNLTSEVVITLQWNTVYSACHCFSIQKYILCTCSIETHCCSFCTLCCFFIWKIKRCLHF